VIIKFCLEHPRIDLHNPSLLSPKFSKLKAGASRSFSAQANGKFDLTGVKDALSSLCPVNGGLVAGVVDEVLGVEEQVEVLGRL